LAVFDLHVHTVRGSSDSSLTPQQLIEEAIRIGLDGVCLTEHGGGWERHELQRVFEQAGLIVIRGLEVDTDMGHVLAFGLHAYLDGIHRIRELRKAVNRAGGVMLSAHPFRNFFNSPPYNLNLVFRDGHRRPTTSQEAASHPLFQVVDDIEVANGSNTDAENLFALDVARQLGFAGTGGSDAHSTHGLGRCVTVFDGEVCSEADLIEAIKAKAFKPAQGFHLGRLQGFV
jgi:predicted metal-dependent phosphoesterase TrpH